MVTPMFPLYVKDGLELYEFTCMCGNTFEAPMHYYRAGMLKSCSCLDMNPNGYVTKLHRYEEQRDVLNIKIERLKLKIKDAKSPYKITTI